MRKGEEKETDKNRNRSIRGERTRRKARRSTFTVNLLK
jgi:hypothetical protein